MPGGSDNGTSRWVAGMGHALGIGKHRLWTPESARTSLAFLDVPSLHPTGSLLGALQGESPPCPLQRAVDACMHPHRSGCLCLGPPSGAWVGDPSLTLLLYSFVPGKEHQEGSKAPNCMQCCQEQPGTAPSLQEGHAGEVVSRWGPLGCPDFWGWKSEKTAAQPEATWPS